MLNEHDYLKRPMSSLHFPPISRHHTTMGLSFLAHCGLTALLWFSSRDFVTPEVPTPKTIEATILPPPEIMPQPQKAERITQPIKPRPKKNRSTTNTNPAPLEGVGLNKPSLIIKDNDISKLGEDVKNELPKEKNTTAKIEKGTPIDVPMTDGGFQIQYDVHAIYKATEADGGATFTYSRTGNTYQASLKAKAPVAKFEATSIGEVRDKTIATTRFKDGRTISFLGIGKERGGTSFNVDYTTQQISFKGANGTQPLAYDAVYDYLSAMVYIQAVLQEKSGRVSTLSLPIGKSSRIEHATVTFEPEVRLSTMEGAFQAIPATIIISSGSITSIKMWFVPTKKYRPLQIEIGFKKGKALLISRASN